MPNTLDSGQKKTRAGSPRLDSVKVLQGGIFLLILMVMISAGLALVHLRNLAETRISTTAQNLASTLELSLDGQIDTVDASLLAAADMISWRLAHGQISTDTATAFLTRQQQTLPSRAFFGAADAAGNVIYGPNVRTPPNNIAERAYFKQLRDNPKAGLVVSSPVRGKLDHKWAWIFARRINLPNGQFAGVVFSHFDIGEIEQTLATIRLSDGDVLAVRAPDMALVARYPLRGIYPIGSQTLTPAFQQAIKAYPLHGNYLSQGSSPSNILRHFSYLKSQQYGYMVLVGLSDQAALEEWRKQVWIVLGIVSIFAVTSLALAHLISHAWSRRDADLQRLRSRKQQLLQTQAALEAMAHHDILTGLPNRKLLADRFNQTQARARRNRQHLALLFLDLDGFKPINDRFGHGYGDIALQQVATRLLHTVRRNDTVARVGGDEFVLLLGDLGQDSRKQIEAVAEKCLRAFDAPFVVNGQPCQLNLSIGLTQGDGNTSLDDLMSAADSAMYRAKEQGKGCAVWIDSPLAPDAADRR